MAKPLLVKAVWDDDAQVWVATSDDVPGLATEAENPHALMQKLQIMIPELLDENGYKDGDEIPFTLQTECTSVAYMNAV